MPPEPPTEKALAHYVSEIGRNLSLHNATEHTHRPALKNLIESLAAGITATNEPKRVECGAPDFVISRRSGHGPATLGYIEAKDVGAILDEVERSEQLKRYFAALPNLILTDYLEFRWYVDGERRLEPARLARVGKGAKLAREKDGAEAVAQMLTAFLTQPAEPISKPKELALRMARLTHFIHDMIVADFKNEAPSATLRDLREAFERALIPDLPVEQFADMFSQTLAYGLFAARVNHRGPRGSFKRLGAAAEIPKTNPFLRKLFETITGPDLDDEPFVGFVDDLAQLLADTEMDAVLADFGTRTARRDPVVHFYETFLAAYDPKLREARGVYYTPEPVVSYIVRSVDHLLKTRFDCAAGLADTTTVEYEKEVDVAPGPSARQKTTKATSPRVLILDPACGTGTFLYSVIDLIRTEFMRQGNAGMWSGYVRNHLLPRIFGFELLMAPYAVAHFKLGMQLAGHDIPPLQREKWAYDFSSDDRLGVYLTNTLEEAERRAETLFGPFRVITDEANAAAKIKRDLPILAVIGNPPYSGHSANRSWEMLPDHKTKKLKRFPTFIGRLVQDYYQVDGHPLGEKNPKWLQNDYVKFIRWAQWRIDRTGAGILAFITDNSYLDSPTFRGMRQQLMSAFTQIHLLDLHGNSKKHEISPDGSPDKNVFDIQQGVTIGIFLKERGAATPGKVFHADLWGIREEKYKTLFETDVSSSAWQKLEPRSPAYLFVPQQTKREAEYHGGISLRETMPINVLGFQTHRDPVAIGFTEDELRAQVTNYLGTAPSHADWTKYCRPCSYRPFDERKVFLSTDVTDRPRLEVVQDLFRKNIAINVARQTKAKAWAHALVSRQPTPAVFLEIKDGSSIFPLYCYHDPYDRLKERGGGSWLPLLPWPESAAGRRPNFSVTMTSEFKLTLGLEFVSEGKGDLSRNLGPEDILNYVYAILYSPSYRRQYSEFLKSDFPRVPLTSDVSLFRNLCAKGAELVALHLLESPILESPITRYPVKGSNLVEKGFPKYVAPGEPEPSTGTKLKSGRVYVNRDQYFDCVAPGVWNFHIGGYQVCEKWLKDRRGRALTYDDQLHYCKVVTALSETLRLMREIDEAIPRWPLP